jgi:hypothetical protein
MWSVLEHELASALLGESEPSAVLARISEVVGEHLGITTTLLEGHRPASPGQQRIVIGTAAEGTASTLVVDRVNALDEEQAQRLARVYALVLQQIHPAPRSAALLHTLRNRLAAVLSNVEFAELVVSAPKTSDPEGERSELLAALAHARRGCEEMSRTLSDVAELEQRR